jgi:hypothetical protein
VVKLFDVLEERTVSIFSGTELFQMVAEVLQRKMCQSERTVGGVWPISYGRWEEALVTFKMEAVFSSNVSDHLTTTWYREPKEYL